MNWKGADSMQDATRQGKILSFFQMKRYESCARERGGMHYLKDKIDGNYVVKQRTVINMTSLSLQELVVCLQYVIGF